MDKSKKHYGSYGLDLKSQNNNNDKVTAVICLINVHAVE